MPSELQQRKWGGIIESITSPYKLSALALLVLSFVFGPLALSSGVSKDLLVKGILFVLSLVVVLAFVDKFLERHRDLNTDFAKLLAHNTFDALGGAVGNNNLPDREEAYRILSVLKSPNPDWSQARNDFAREFAAQILIKQESIERKKTPLGRLDSDYC